MISTLTCSRKEAVILSCFEMVTGERGKDHECRQGGQNTDLGLSYLFMDPSLQLVGPLFWNQLFRHFVLCYFICKNRDNDSNFYTVFFCGLKGWLYGKHGEQCQARVIMSSRSPVGRAVTSWFSAVFPGQGVWLVLAVCWMVGPRCGGRNVTETWLHLRALSLLLSWPCHLFCLFFWA